jgi:hypothetical protein
MAVSSPPHCPNPALEADAQPTDSGVDGARLPETPYRGLDGAGGGPEPPPPRGARSQAAALQLLALSDGDDEGERAPWPGCIPMDSMGGHPVDAGRCRIAPGGVTHLGTMAHRIRRELDPDRGGGPAHVCSELLQAGVHEEPPQRREALPRGTLRGSRRAAEQGPGVVLERTGCDRQGLAGVRPRPGRAVGRPAGAVPPGARTGAPGAGGAARAPRTAAHSTWMPS